MSDEALFERKLLEHIAARGLEVEHFVYAESCHSVPEAAAAAGVTIGDLIKSICMMSGTELVVAIVKGEDAASTSRVGKLLELERPRPATLAEMLERTGYPAGGTPPFGFEARFLVDERVLEKDFVYGGGGSARSLVRLAPTELVRANGARVARVRR